MPAFTSDSRGDPEINKMIEEDRRRAETKLKQGRYNIWRMLQRDHRPRRRRRPRF